MDATAAETQEAAVTAGQRRVNLVWEATQACIALAVVGVNLFVGFKAALAGGKMDVPPSLSNALFLVVGFYFSRTNHAAIGGIGAKPTVEYKGR